MLVANVRWLSRYRHQRCMVPEIAGVLLEAFTGGRGLFEVLSWPSTGCTGLRCCSI